LNDSADEIDVTTTDPLRFSVPLYTVADVALIVGAPSSTIGEWANGRVSQRIDGQGTVVAGPVITRLGASVGREPSIPFVGLAEALVLAAVRRSGVPMQRVRPALSRLQSEIGLHHALASRKLYTDGAEILFDVGERSAEPSDAREVRRLVVVRNGQHVFTDVVAAYLQRIQYGDDGYANLIRVPAYENADVVADPTRSFGAPIFERGGARVDDVLERFWAGENLSDLAEDFGVPVDQLEDVLRVASRRAA
jgi:uncharacterized protein (DUF433 family)